jgi:hypothetical protein
VNGIPGASDGNDGNIGTGNSFLVDGIPGAGILESRCGSFDCGGLSACFGGPCNNVYALSMVDSVVTNGNLILIQLRNNNFYTFTGCTGGTLVGGQNFRGGHGFTGGGNGSTNNLNGATAGGGGGGFSGGSVNYYFGGGGGSSYVSLGI